MSLTSFMMKMMTKKGRKVREELERATFCPRETQEALLFRLLEKAKDTEYGKKYNLGAISSVEEFQNRVPISDYDTYSEYIERMIIGRIWFRIFEMVKSMVKSKCLMTSVLH